jgi:hypothetical protein
VVPPHAYTRTGGLMALASERCARVVSLICEIEDQAHRECCLDVLEKLMQARAADAQAIREMLAQLVLVRESDPVTAPPDAATPRVERRSGSVLLSLAVQILGSPGA